MICTKEHVQGTFVWYGFFLGEKNSLPGPPSWGKSPEPGGFRRFVVIESLAPLMWVVLIVGFYMYITH